nr:unnamed protein product [Callosobruchus analis]
MYPASKNYHVQAG